MGPRPTLNRRTKGDRATVSHVAGVPRDINSSPNQPNLPAFCLESQRMAPQRTEYSSKCFRVFDSRAAAPAKSEIPKELLLIPDLYVQTSHLCRVTWRLCSVMVPSGILLLPVSKLHAPSHMNQQSILAS